MMQRSSRYNENMDQDQRGFALFAVMLFSVIVGITGLAFFSMTSSEFKGASDRQRSVEAFYLADGSLGAARGALLDDQSWRGPIPETQLGSGTFLVSAVDTVEVYWPGQAEPQVVEAPAVGDLVEITQE